MTAFLVLLRRDLLLAKALAHWIATGLPLCAAAPLLGLLLHLPGAAMPVLAAALLLGTPTLSLLGAWGAAGDRAVGGDGIAVGDAGPDFRAGAGGFGDVWAGGGGAAPHPGGHGAGRAGDLSAGGGGGLEAGGGVNSGDGVPVLERVRQALSRAAQSARFVDLSGRVLPWTAALAVVLFIAGLVLVLVLSPADHRQGDGVHVMCILHVPAAWMGLVVYVLVAVLGGIGLVGGHPLAFHAARAASPVGAAFTFLYLVGGVPWGKPMGDAW